MSPPDAATGRKRPNLRHQASRSFLVIPWGSGKVPVSPPERCRLWKREGPSGFEPYPCTVTGKVS